MNTLNITLLVVELQRPTHSYHRTLSGIQYVWKGENHNRVTQKKKQPFKSKQTMHPRPLKTENASKDIKYFPITYAKRVPKRHYSSIALLMECAFPSINTGEKKAIKRDGPRDA
ncbi:hypothetical protein CEXT_283931 [Caerostris extrusa]|uniref:Uncharacterized protein n=1 Tax=Caerostris extrusa TaxID=172846 RepID=A0AAV4XFF6_CAEEX|nr:hypothetical protein CEXT_283931 [Caerostris extrusa]